MAVHYRRDRIGPDRFLGTALRWFGVISTAFTVFSNAGAFLEFSDFVREWTDRWREAVGWLVNSVLSIFRIEVDLTPAVIGFAVISCMIVALTAQRGARGEMSTAFRILGALSATAFSTLYLNFVILGATSSDPRFGDELAQNLMIGAGASLILAVPLYTRRPLFSAAVRKGIGGGIFALALGFIALVLIYETQNEMPFGEVMNYAGLAVMAVIGMAMYYASDIAQITLRGFAITLLIGALIALNQISKIVEDFGVEAALWGAASLG